MTRDVIVIGASSGGIDALRTIASQLPADLPAAICVVIHVAPESPGSLHELFTRSSKVPTSTASDGESLKPGHIYFAPPDHHLLIGPGTLRLTRGPKENRFRPAIDTLFRSAAQAYGPKVVGVVLSGDLDDGTAGLLAVKEFGGIAVVQDPEEALFPSMPRSAREHVKVDYCLPVAEIAPLLVSLSRGRVGPDGTHQGV